MTTEERFKVLEAELRETKNQLSSAKLLIHSFILGISFILLLCIIGLTAFYLTGVAYSQDEKVIRTNKLIIEDAAGKERAVLGVGEDGESSLIMYGKKDKLNSLLNAYSLNLYKGEEIRSTMLSIDMLYFMNKQGNIFMSVSENGCRVKLDDGKENSIQLNSNGLYINKNLDKIRAVLVAEAVSFSDNNGFMRAGMFLDDNGEPFISLSDKQGKTIFSFP